ncbi:hypothetical protein [Microbacterium gilvum]|uniref:ABC transporter permease n=1 Tax=Microbacterium gilvum TaxID=1336204 RepID=A0ABP9A3H3_9MICO
MTAIDLPAATPSSRILNVVRLQFINTQTFVWVPALVLGGSWLITMAIYWIINAASDGAAGPMFGGGSQAPLWYFLAIGIQAMTMSFPFSQAMSLTRREFSLGSLAAASVSAAGMALVFVLLGLLEQATDGYGVNGWFAYLDWVWVAGPLAAWFIYFVASLLFFILGFWCATIYKRWGTAAVTTALLAIALVLLGFVAVVTLNEAWPGVWTWILDTGALGLAFWGALLAVVLAAGSYATLRRMPA